MKLSPTYFQQTDVVQLARDLIGKVIYTHIDHKLCSGVISETEAYDGTHDLACHARVGKTNRNEVMFGAAGHAYVYFTYGMHWCLNVVTGEVGYPAAVLIRAIEPLEGNSIIAHNRPNVEPKNWTNGPAKLTKAMQINKEQNGVNLTYKESNLWIENGITIQEESIITTPRIGINNTPEPWRSMPWRYVISLNKNDRAGVE